MRFFELPQSFQLSQDKAAATTAATKYGSTHATVETEKGIEVDRVRQRESERKGGE